MTTPKNAQKPTPGTTVRLVSEHTVFSLTWPAGTHGEVIEDGVIVGPQTPAVVVRLPFDGGTVRQVLPLTAVVVVA